VEAGSGSTLPHASVAATAAGGYFWSALPSPDQAAMLAAGTVRTYARGRALLLQEQMPDAVIVLRSGQVKVSRSTTTGREVVLAIRGPGELLGELAALDGQPRSASVVALEPVEALVLSPHAFRTFLAEHPAASMALLGMLTRRLRDADAKRAGFSSLTTLGRVAERVLELAERFGTEEQGYTRIELRISQDELAAWSGASLESAVRALATMRSLHWIETGRREIRVLDMEAVRRAAG
jgi:CRP-like cAMP-binding protein